MIANHIWQSTVFSIAISLLAVALRDKRAAVRHCLWLTASIKFLIPFSFLSTIRTHIHWTPGPAAVSTAIAQFNEPFSSAGPFAFLVPSAQISVHEASRIPEVLLGIWCLGLLASVVLWFRQWRQLEVIKRAATPLKTEFPIPVLLSGNALEPGVFGIWRPVLLVPEGIHMRLSKQQLQAVLAHEHAHVRRRDNLSLAVQGVVESLFWFHPFVWWVRAHLIEEQERACDEAVLTQGGDPEIYAQSIVRICEFYVAAPRICTAGISGADLKKRIRAIMQGRALRLGWGGIALLTMMAAAALAIPILSGQQKTREEFEAASIRASDPNAPPTPGSRGGNFGPCTSSAPQLDPSHLMIANATLYTLIADAYGQNACMRWFKYGMLTGGPDWIRSEKFTVQATFPEGMPRYTRMQVMEGEAPRLQEMLQLLLEDRFKLAFHRAKKDISLYELAPGKDGLKLDWNGLNTSEGARITKTDECENVDPTVPGPPSAKPFCGSRLLTFAGSPPKSWLLSMTGVPPDQLASMLEFPLDRPVLNKTGISGKISVRFTFAFDENTPLPDDARNMMATEPDPSVPSIFAALQEKLGLRLVPAKGSIDIMVIDHVERPVN